MFGSASSSSLPSFHASHRRYACQTSLFSLSLLFFLQSASPRLLLFILLSFFHQTDRQKDVLARETHEVVPGLPFFVFPSLFFLALPAWLMHSSGCSSRFSLILPAATLVQNSLCIIFSFLAIPLVAHPHSLRSCWYLLIDFVRRSASFRVGFVRSGSV